MSNLKAASTGLALLLAGLLMSILMAEILLRVFIPEQLPFIRTKVWMPKPELGYEKYPNLDSKTNAGEGSVRLIHRR